MDPPDHKAAESAGFSRNDDDVAAIMDVIRGRLNGDDEAPVSLALRAFEFEIEIRDIVSRAASAAVGWENSAEPSTSGRDESNAWRAQLLPRVVAVRPPSWAVKAYKMVCLKDGVPVSVFDGTTEYRLGQTVMQRAADQHRGGLYVYRSLERCLARARKLFPKKSALLKGPRAVLRVMAWNEERIQMPVKYDGEKEAYTFVHPVAVLDMPPSWGVGDGGGSCERALAEVTNEEDKSDAWHHKHESENRVASIARRRARTMLLEEEVAQMERRLADFTSVGQQAVD